MSQTNTSPEKIDAEVKAIEEKSNFVPTKKSTSYRPSFEEIYTELAAIFALRSTCSRAKVGTVISTTDYRRVLACGYNGNASGLPNCCDAPEESGKCGCLHSEENAVINCQEPRTTDKYVFVTLSPCVACAKRIINLGGVKRVYYGKPYRDLTGIELLKKVGIEAVHFQRT